MSRKHHRPSVAELRRQADALEASHPATAAEVRRAFLANQASALQSYAPSVADWRITVAETRRQAFEDQRANRRNRNRLLTILVGLLGSLLIPTALTVAAHAGLISPAMTMILTRYMVALIVIPDVAVTAYALWRRY